MRESWRFADRREAGRRLAAAVRTRLAGEDVVVLALPRGGVPVAVEIARALDAPLDVLVVRKLGAPGHPELAMGAITADTRVLNESVIASLGISAEEIAAVESREREELERRERAYRGEEGRVEIEGRIAVLVDDGAATGATMRVAVAAARAREPARVVVAVPVAAPETCRTLEEEADEAVCLQTPARLGGIGAWYLSFPQVPDEEVVRRLEETRGRGRRGW